MGVSFGIEEIQGQEKALVFLKKYALHPDLIPPLLVFHGPEGTGKEAAVERFIRHVLCLEGTSCGVCPSCRAFMHHTHPDIVWFPADRNKQISIGNEENPEEFTIRWLIRTRLYYKPHVSKLRFIIIPDASMIGNEAETALLKSLEESPAFTRFIFLVNSLDSLKETIVSRAVCIPFGYLPQEIVRKLHQKEGKEYFSFQGGSMETFDCPKEALDLVISKISDRVQTPLHLLHLEEWILNYKDDHPEWREGFSFKDLLDLVSLVLLQEFSKSSFEENFPKLEAIFRFKENLHQKIHGQENIILSQLIHELSLLSNR
ncbi:DNA polymerase III, delta subunit [Leptospira fainei serovar Hurstbridge str. BUT 6]|uniref:DNA polymerase III, delta subunit n=1 Tax=Leptospira fainei serovar Hurstbridge str. BUT 6 TaxID=1193011 RepID=S3VAD2_9LEPT|nr:hypothetical protein [Leptospira fainei]EPG73415.1 DNA polymerase III, delta subunit [Leptospira fainei serovar Hurstbridge str. BUT 6]